MNNDLLLLQGDLDYHVNRNRDELQPARYRRWRRRVRLAGRTAATDVASWIS